VSTDIIILDTKLLTLFVVGLTSRKYISAHKRLSPYTEKDFDILTALISKASGMVATPNTLTETSNFIKFIAEPARTQIYRIFGALVKTTNEEYIASSQGVDRDEFVRLGLTDSVLLDVTSVPHTLLTDDLNLYLAATHKGYSAVNFTHVRTYPP
jgi:hypothetical protein